MNCNDILNTAKPIFFNTEMVRAILDGRKTVTRRVLKPHNAVKAKKCEYYQGSGLWYDDTFNEGDKDTHIKDYSVSCCWIGTKIYTQKYAQYKPGDILYVRETWAKTSCFDCNCNDEECEYNIDRNGLTVFCNDGVYVYKATDLVNTKPKWHSSIHMPKEAARIFLKVTDVRVERLQDIDDDGAKAEGVNWRNGKNVGVEEKARHSAIERFQELWNSTTKESDLDKYGWNANPWVWVVEFERIRL